MCLQSKPFENTVGEEEIGRNEQLLLFPVFLAFFIEFGKVENLPLGKRLRVTCSKHLIYTVAGHSALCLGNTRKLSC